MWLLWRWAWLGMGSTYDTGIGLGWMGFEGQTDAGLGQVGVESEVAGGDQVRLCLGEARCGRSLVEGGWRGGRGREQW